MSYLILCNAKHRCPQYCQRKLCTHKKDINEKKLEAYLLENIESEINGYIVQCQLTATVPAPRTGIDKTKVKAKLERLKELYVNELIDLDAYKTDYALYIRQLEQEPDPTLPKADIAKLNDFLKSNLLGVYQTLPKLEQRNF